MRKLLAISLLFSFVFVGCQQQEKTENEKVEKKEEVYDDGISNRNWRTSGDESLLQLHDDGTYDWYLDDTDKKDNITSGDYKVYKGEKAQSKFKRLATDEGLDYDAFEDYLEDDETPYDKDDFVLFYLNRTNSIIDGEKDDTKQKVYYFGFAYKEGKNRVLDVANFTTMNYVLFTLEK